MTPSMLEEIAKGLALSLGKPNQLAMRGIFQLLEYMCVPKYTHVKAHSGDPLNEAVDVLATAARTGVIPCSEQLSHQIQQVAKHHDAVDVACA